MAKSETDYKKIGKNSIYIYFWLTFIIVLCYGCFIFNIKYSKSINIGIFIAIYSIVLFFYILFTNLAITQSLCGTKKFNMAFMSTLIPFLFIYTLVMLMIYFFLPGWVRVFSNTFGLTISKLCGMDKIVQKIFNNNSQDDSFAKQLYQNPYIYINELNLNEFFSKSDKDNNSSQNSTQNLTSKANEIFKNQLGDLGNNIKIDETDLKELLKYLNLKEIIGYSTWILLLGMLTILSSFNFILSHHCNIDNNNNSWMEDLETDL